MRHCSIWLCRPKTKQVRNVFVAGTVALLLSLGARSAPHASNVGPAVGGAVACTGANFIDSTAFSFSFGNSPQSVAVGDFNLDGNPDLGVVISHAFVVLLGDGMDSFVQAAGSPIPTGLNSDSVAVGDFNADGKPDVVVTNQASDNVTILLGNGTGAFIEVAGSPVGVGALPTSVAIGDFDNDGNPDLAVTNFLSNDVTILLGDGVGGFTQHLGSPITVGPFPEWVAVSDFNLDSNADLAVANGGSSNVTILLGNGSGHFTQPAGSPVAAGGVPRSLAVGDFNIDGRPDLAVANFFSDNVTILLGNATGQFSQPAGSPVSAATSPNSLVIGDFNLDGRPDLAVANHNSANVTILLGNGLGNFTEPTGSPVDAGQASTSVAMGDFNLDGSPDLAVANRIPAGAVTLLLNTCANIVSLCLEDDNNGNQLQFNSSTGDYRFTDCRKAITLTGTGRVTNDPSGCKVTLQDSGPIPKRPDRSVLVKVNRCTQTARASIVNFVSGSSSTINDTDMTNNSCVCR